MNKQDYLARKTFNNKSYKSNNSFKNKKDGQIILRGNGQLQFKKHK